MMSFVDQYFGAANFNATKAYELSAYSKSKNPNLNAAELLNHPLVRAEIELRQQKRTEKSEVQASYLINKLMNIIEATEVDNPTAALRAIELAGKSIALWKERQELSGPDGAAIKHEQNIKESVSEFTSRISSLAKRSGQDNVIEFPERAGASGA
jgi:hypothetical protein